MKIETESGATNYTGVASNVLTKFNSICDSHLLQPKQVKKHGRSLKDKIKKYNSLKKSDGSSSGGGGGVMKGRRPRCECE